MPDNIFSDRISDVPRSFIREILKVAISKDVISFAGGLPNRDLFPVKEIEKATNMVFREDDRDAFQYSNSEGFLPLREYICERYLNKKGFNISPENVLITTGSQQALDLIAKSIINENDEIIIEEPGYLGAIQAFSVYQAKFCPVSINNEGVDTNKLKELVSTNIPKLMYCVPNFNNPAGISYSNENREKIMDILKEKRLYLVEDDPYGEIRFEGEEKQSFYSLMPEKTILLGSFSKTVVPSFRIGWIVAPDDIMDKLIIAKQASDLHTNFFSQKILYYYLRNNNVDDHIRKISNLYGSQKKAMIKAIRKYFPENVSFTEPEGGMFLWVTLPMEISSMELFNKAIENKVAFVPGNPFYTGMPNDVNTLRLNFSCVDEVTIEKGIKRLGEAINDIING